MFTSWQFWVFTLVVLCVHNRLPNRSQNVILLIASYIVYAALDLPFWGLLLFSTAFNFFIARQLVPDKHYRQTYLYAGLLFNLMLLGIFKYTGLATSVHRKLTLTSDIGIVDTLIPIGISFYTFRQLSYLLDVYHKRIAPCSNGIDFALYVAFFPQIVAGPIERATHFLPLLQQTRRILQKQFLEGLTLVIMGMYCKVVVADPLVPTVSNAFVNVQALSATDALATMILCGVQLYADFAGYSAIAIGVSKWFGLSFSVNFQTPYFAHSITDFWTRWHISLSFWFRDYLFYPLSRFLLRKSGSRNSFYVQVVSHLVTMLTTGLWHGSSPTFLIWGMIHGLYLIAERVNKQLTWFSRRPLPKAAAILITQIAVFAAWIFFRSPSVSTALVFFQRLISPDLLSGLTLQWWVKVSVPIILLFVFDLSQFITSRLLLPWRMRLVWRVLWWTLMFLSLFTFWGAERASFIYARF